MNETDRIFERFPPFIQEFIYSHSWDSLRPVQIAAARTLFETDNNLLLTSSAASGKT
jgi:ATP-dependent Lhr-like helicase